MFKYRFSFVALTDSANFEIISRLKEPIEEFVKDLLFIFATINGEVITVESFQQNSDLLKEKIKTFTEKYKSILPQINGLPAYFRKLNTNENLFFLPNMELNTYDNLKLYNYLTAISEGRDFKKLQDQTKELFENFFEQYNVDVFGDKRVSIGEPSKKKRVCRFCKNKRKNISFSSRAHGISEALGNKTIILHDECDQCNIEFSKTIESHIIQYLALFRSFYDIKGKAGSKKFKGKNFDIKNEDKLIISSYINDEELKNPEKHNNIRLVAQDPLILQNIYKCLCKYFLSVIDPKYLDSFNKTIDWINRKLETNKLPLIGEMLSYHSFSYQPKLTIYIRKNNNTQIPFAVGEFYFACKIFVFIIPFCNKDDRDFINEKDFKNYWNTFKHYNKSKGWVFNDYSDKSLREFKMNINIEMKDKTNIKKENGTK